MGDVCSKKKPGKIEYFKILKKNMKLSYNSNFSNNKEYITKKKKFDSKNEYNEYLEENNENLWKIYLLDKINEDKLDFKNKAWKVFLYEFIDETQFYYQYLFQNEIVYQEILLNKPKTKNKENDDVEFHFLDTEPIFSPLDLDELRALSRTESTFSSKKIGDNISYFKVNSKVNADENNEITISLTMKTINEEINNQELIAKYNSYMLKKYLKIIRIHLEKEIHPLNQIIKKFTKLIVTQIRIIITTMRENEDDTRRCFNLGLEIVKEIIKFIEIMQVALKLFYSKSINFKYFEEEKDEIINLISYIIFKDKEFYIHMKNLFSYMNIQKMRILESRFKKSKEITPSELGVNPKFCLDKTTEDFWEDYKKKKNNKINNNDDKSSGINFKREETITCNIDRKNNLKKYVDVSVSEIFTENNKQQFEIYRSWTYVNKEEEDDISGNQDNITELSLDKIKINIKEKIINDFKNTLLPSFPDVVSPPESTKLFEPNEPYNMALYYLSQIDNYQVPLEKLIMISFLSVIIMESIDKFWKSKNIDLPPEFLTISADDVMTIYLYIIYKLGYKSIVVQLDFIKYFTTTFTKQSLFGYYYSTFEGCIRYLVEEDKDSANSSK